MRPAAGRGTGTPRRAIATCRRDARGRRMSRARRPRGRPSGSTDVRRSGRRRSRRSRPTRSTQSVAEWIAKQREVARRAARSTIVALLLGAPRRLADREPARARGRAQIVAASIAAHVVDALRGRARASPRSARRRPRPGRARRAHPRAVHVRRYLGDEQQRAHGERHGSVARPMSGGAAMRIGFVGLGAMGLPMTRHLVEAGHDVTVASRSSGPIDDRGALWRRRKVTARAASPRRAMWSSSASPTRRRSWRSSTRHCPSSGTGRSSSTRRRSIRKSSAPQHARVAAAGGRYLEAPLSGGTAGAERGTLTLMVGGDEDVLDAARPALDPFSALDRARRRAGHRPGREALQPAHLRGTDARDGRSHR